MQRAAQAVGGKWKIRPKGAKGKLRHRLRKDGTESSRTLQP
jgi:hypothetical protein